MRILARLISLRFSIALVFAFVPCIAPLAQTKPEPAPIRPKLAAATDTNDARAYLDFGLKVFENDPGSAVDAFFWATRLNPADAEAYYERRSALICGNAMRRRSCSCTNRRRRSSTASACCSNSTIA